MGLSRLDSDEKDTVGELQDVLYSVLYLRVYNGSHLVEGRSAFDDSPWQSPNVVSALTNAERAIKQDVVGECQAEITGPADESKKTSSGKLMTPQFRQRTKYILIITCV